MSNDTYGIEDISDSEIHFNAVFLSFVMLITIVGNTLALHAFFVSSELKKITYYFIASLCISDLLVAVFSMSLWIIDLLNRWGPNQISSYGLPIDFKVLYQCVDIFGGTWSIMSLAFISIERYICIKYSLHYQYIMTLERVYIIFMFLIVYCSVVTVLNTLIIDENGIGHIIKQFCIVFMAYLFPVLIKIFTYSKIYLEAKKQSKKIRHLRKYTPSPSYMDSSMEKSNLIEMDSCHTPRVRTSETEGVDVKIHLFTTKKGGLSGLNCLCSTRHLNNKTDSNSSLDSIESNNMIRIHRCSSELSNSILSEDCASCTNHKIITESFTKNGDAKSVQLKPKSETFLSQNSFKQKLTPNCEHSGSPLRVKLRTVTKWSPAASPLLIRKFCNKKSSEQKRNEQKIRTFKKEIRAAKVVGLIMGTFLICWTPFNILMLLFAINIDTVMRYIMLAKLLHYLNSAINPILYVVFNKIYRNAVLKVIKQFRIFRRC